MFGMGPAELAIIGVLAVLLFGRNLPSVARSVGQSFHEFKSALRNESEKEE